MSELRKTYPGGLFFLTLTVVGWVDVFIRPQYTQIIIDSLRYCQLHKGLELYAYVVMSSHVHLIAARTEGNLSDVLRDLKAHTARQLLKAIAENEHESRREWMMRLFAYYARNARTSSICSGKRPPSQLPSGPRPSCNRKPIIFITTPLLPASSPLRSIIP